MSAEPPLYLLDIPVSGHWALYISLLSEPGADGLEGAISTAPAFVIHTVLHVVVVTVGPLNQVHLKTHKSRMHLSVSLQTLKHHTWHWLVPVHHPGRDV